MKNYQKILAAAFFLIFIIPITIVAQGTFEIRLSSEKTEFKLGEPVVVLVSVTNKGQQPVNISPELGPEADFLQYKITNPDGKEKAFSPLFVEDRANFITLKRNETATGTARIYYGGNGYSFPKAGNYKITARYKASRSAPLNIRVISPINEQERKQANLILNYPEVGLFLMLEGGDELTQAQKCTDTLIREFPTSILSQYVKYAVAKNLSIPARNFVSKKPRSADLPKAIQMLQDLKDKEFSAYYQTKAISALASSLSKTGRKEEATKMLQDFRTNLDRKANLRPYFIKHIDEEISKIR